MTRHQLHQKDQIITPLIAQGQSPYQILINHPELDMSVRSMYTYIDKGLFTARNVDLKRQAKFKPRKCHKTQIKDRKVFTNRTYADFCSMELDSYVQMDTVKVKGKLGEGINLLAELIGRHRDMAGEELRKKTPAVIAEANEVGAIVSMWSMMEGMIALALEDGFVTKGNGQNLSAFYFRTKF